MDRKEKLEMLQKLSEKELTKNFLIPLYQSMGYTNVRYAHRQGLEFGKDIICCKVDEYEILKFTGVQVKREKITTADVARIAHQIREAFGKSFIDTDGEEQFLDNFVVLTSNEFLEDAKESLWADIERDTFKKLLTLVDGNQLVTLLDKHLPSAFWDEYDCFNKYFNAMKTDFKKIKDITAIGQKEPIPLEEIFVSLKLAKKLENVRFQPRKNERYLKSN